MQELPEIGRGANLFVVSTPLQVLNSREAVEHFGLQDQENWLIFIDNHSFLNSLQTKLLIAKHAWPRVVTLPPDRRHLRAVLRHARRRPGRRRWLARADRLLQAAIGTPLDVTVVGRSTHHWMNALARRCHDIERVFIGYFGSPVMRHFSNVVRPKEEIILEEGSNQINVYESVNAEGRNEHVWPFYLDTVGNLVKRMLFGVNLTPHYPLHFFTAYDLPSTPKIRITPNDYRYFRANIRPARTVPEAYFLGEWLTEWKCLSDEAYVEYLGKVADLLPGQRLVFIPHRRTLMSTQRMIQERLGVEVRRLNGPVELIMAEANERPATLAGFFSSGLFNVSMLYGSSIEVVAFKLPPRDKQPRIDQFIADFYRYCGLYFRDKIRVVNVS